MDKTTDFQSKLSQAANLIEEATEEALAAGHWSELDAGLLNIQMMMPMLRRRAHLAKPTKEMSSREIAKKKLGMSDVPDPFSEA